LRELITKIRVSSQHRDKLSSNCKTYNISDLKPILDVPTRWNSTYDIIERSLFLKEVFFILLYYLYYNFIIIFNLYIFIF